MKPDRPPYRVYLGEFPDAENYPGECGQPGNFIVTDQLQPLFITTGINGTIGSCTLQQHPYAIGGYPDPDLVDERTPVVIYSLDYSADKNNPTQSDGPVFSGVIYKTIEKVSGDFTSVTHIAYNRADDYLRRDIIHGQWWKDNTTEQAYYDNGVNNTPIAGTFIQVEKPTILNPQGNFNCSEQVYNNGDGDICVFDIPDRTQYNGTVPIKSFPWTIRSFLVYIREFTNIGWAIDLDSMSDSALEEVFGDYQSERDPVLFNVNLSGKTIAGAMTEILDTFGYGYVVTPYTNNDGLHSVFFFAKNAIYDYSTDPATLLYTPDSSGTISMDGVWPTQNCINYEITKDATPVVDDIWIMGNQINMTSRATSFDNPAGVRGGLIPTQNTPRAVVELPLMPGWTSNDLTWIDDTGNPVTPGSVAKINASGALYQNTTTDITGKKVYGVGRTWIAINTGEIPEQFITDLHALIPPIQNTSSGKTTDSNWVNDIRKILSPQYYTQLSSTPIPGGTDNTGTYNQLPVTLEISTDSGGTWQVVDENRFDTSKDFCGIVLTDQDITDIGYNIQNAATQSNYWQSLFDGTLRMRLLVSIYADDRVTAVSDRVNWYGGDSPLATFRIYENLGYNRYAFQPSGTQTIIYVYVNPYVDEVDDSESMKKVANKVIDTVGKTPFSGGIVLLVDPAKTFETLRDYSPGFVVDAILNRRDFTSNPPMIVATTLDCVSRHLQLSVTFDGGFGIQPVKDDNYYKRENQFYTANANGSDFITAGQMISNLSKGGN